jgi:predicted Zn-dependent protease
MKSWKEFLIVLTICAVVVGFNLRSNSESEAESEIGGFNTPEYEPVDLSKGLGPPKRDLVLVQLDEDPELVEWCKKEIAASTGAKVVEVVSLKDFPDGIDSYNEERQQDDAEVILRALSRDNTYADIAVLAVTSKDLYTSGKPEWRYCFGSHGANATAVISSVRMGGRFQEGLFPTKRSKDRFRKLLLRYTLEMVYEVPRNSDPTSLLYNRVLAPRDLTMMEYRI